MARRRTEPRKAQPGPPNGRRLSLGQTLVLVATALLGVGGGLAAATWYDTRVSPAVLVPVTEVGPPRIGDAPAPGLAPTGTVWIPGGVFTMGNERFPDAVPLHAVEVDGFWMDRTEVTNAEFQKFVEATGYVTVAEKKPQGKLENRPLVPFSFVFNAPKEHVDPNTCSHYVWWPPVQGANWRHPEGPGSDLKGRENHPVVQVAYPDACAYATWARKRLPTEAEWEFAARGGLDGKRFCWGDDVAPDGKHLANTWQGHFPNTNTGADGFLGSAPVASFPPNGYGLYDMAGNVWEWCSDWYHPRAYAFGAAHNPQGPRASFDPDEPGVAKRVHRGGSYLCAENFCQRYQPGARGKGEPESATNHLGFRCVQSPGHVR